MTFTFLPLPFYIFAFDNVAPYLQSLLLNNISEWDKYDEMQLI